MKSTNHLSRKDKVEVILEAIPCDRWVSATEISAETGIDSHNVGALIGTCLLRKINDVKNDYEDMMVDLRKINNWVKKHWRLKSQLPTS